MTAGAHAKCEEVAAGAIAGDERVIGVSQSLLQMPSPILNPIHKLLRMLDAHAKLKCLLFHRHAAPR